VALRQRKLTEKEREMLSANPECVRVQNTPLYPYIVLNFKVKWEFSSCIQYFAEENTEQWMHSTTSKYISFVALTNLIRATLPSPLRQVAALIRRNRSAICRH
jgi:hypothetical protein